MVRDQPSQHLEDLVSEAAWGEKHPLGRSITGTDLSLDSFQRDDVERFFHAGYCGANTIVSVAGNIEHDQVADVVSAQLGSIPAGAPIVFEPAPKPYTNHRFREEKAQEQVHFSLSYEGVNRYDPARFAHKLLNVILGENMSSRLFQELREKRGLCYEVQSDFVSFADAGLIQIYLALSPGHLQEALGAIDEVLRELAENGVSESELESAKAYIVGQSRISLENTASQMMWAGECFLFFDDWRDPEEAHQKIEETSLSDVHAAAKQLFGTRSFSSALIGPAESNTVVEDWRRAVV